MSHVPQLERDLLAAARRRSRRKVLTRGRWSGALALTGIAVAVGGAGAATGLLDVGDQVATPRERQGDGLRYTSARTIVATGRTPLAGRWEMSVTQSDQGPCEGLRLLDGPTGGGLGEGCGSTSTFTAGSTSNGFPIDRPELANRWMLVHGRTAEAAEAVELAAPGGVRIRAKTHDGPPYVDGNFYLLEAPGGLRNATVTELGSNGQPLTTVPGLSVPGTVDFDRGGKRSPGRGVRPPAG